MIFVGGLQTLQTKLFTQPVLQYRKVWSCGHSASQSPDGDEEKWKVPVVLFPGGSHALSPAADAITFMMLMNSTDRRFLVGEQVRGAPYIDKFGIDALPTGYVVCHPGGKVGEVGSADLIMPEEPS